ncbi:MAG TPA: hypothetical protein VGJ26_11280 [Pirellulales bacterium]|jgi:hypothetical protein
MLFSNKYQWRVWSGARRLSVETEGNAILSSLKAFDAFILAALEEDQLDEIEPLVHLSLDDGFDVATSVHDYPTAALAADLGIARGTFAFDQE